MRPVVEKLAAYRLATGTAHSLKHLATLLGSFETRTVDTYEAG